MSKRDLTEEEKRLWREFMKDATPLEAVEKALKAPPKTKPSAKTPLPPMPRIHKEPPLAKGSYAGIDRNTAERFRKGHAAIDATLDLHGMTRDKARRALYDFIHRQSERGSRVLLAITGKGAPKQKDMPAEPERGILRTELPRWLGEPELKSLILAFDVAQARHGGSGAYYILLRRKR